MKKSLLLIFGLIILTCSSCKEKIDIAKEKEAVLKVLREEGDAFVANDLKRISAIHIQDSTQTRLGQGPTSATIYKGWDRINRLYENYFKANSTDSSWKNPENLKENLIIKIAGNSAWVLCDNVWEYEFDNAAQKQTNIQIAFFEKVNGEWKFSFNAFIQKPVPKPEPEE